MYIKLYNVILIFALFSCTRPEISKYTEYINHSDTVAYVGKETCKQCHYKIYESYMQTAMGQSFRFATSENSSIDTPKLVNDPHKNLSYVGSWKNDSLWLKEYRLFENDTIHIIDKKVDFIIGSGHHTNSHLFAQNGYVHQMPYTYYTQDKIFDLPPGFENGNNSRFDREIGTECMSCHNAHADYYHSNSNRFHEIPQGIDCENCHGPGEAHVKRIQKGIMVDTSYEIDYSIVNPAKLPIDLQFDVCQRCHLQGTAVLNNDKDFYDFKPGQKLNEFIDVYLPKYENEDLFIMASHVERFKLSECYKNSEMTCITCHNPHKSVRQTDAAFFDAKCMNCHNVCSEEKNINNCASCHMPNSSSIDIPHVSITDHKISIPKEMKKKEFGNFLGLFAINNSNPTNLSKAKAYLKRYESFEQIESYLDSAFFYLEKCNIKQCMDVFIDYYFLSEDFRMIVNLDMQYDIIDNFSDLGPNSYSRIAYSYENFEMWNDAIKQMNFSCQLNPNDLKHKNKLGTYYVKSNNISKAKEIFLDIISLNPNFKEPYLNLGYINLVEKNYKLSEDYLSRAIALDPDYVLAYENLARLKFETNNKIDYANYLKKIQAIQQRQKKL